MKSEGNRKKKKELEVSKMGVSIILGGGNVRLYKWGKGVLELEIRS